MTPKEALKGKKVFIYARVSTDGQEGTLPDQIKTVEKGLKELGFSGKPEIFS
jgi:predicted site-specific integrase-resolvase